MAMDKNYDEDQSNMSQEEINKKADDLAKNLYEENKEIIDVVTDEEKETIDDSYKNQEKPAKKAKMTTFKATAIILGICFFALILILIVCNVISVGQDMLEKNQYLGIAFYVVVGILVTILIIIPTIQIFFLPTYGSLFSEEEDGKEGKIKANRKKILMIVDKHQKEWKIDELKPAKKEEYYEKLDKLKNSKDMDEVKKAYHYIYKKYIKKDVLQIVTSYSNKIFLGTAVVQSGKMDSFLLFSTYVKMSKDILYYCGYRVSFVRFCKLMYHVLTMVLAATKLGDVDFSSLFPQAMMDYLAKIPGAKTIVNSLSDGVINSLLFYKTGVMLEEYLLSDNQNILYQWAVAIKETAKYMLVGLVGEIIRKIAEFTAMAFKKAVQGIKNFFASMQTMITMKKEQTDTTKKIAQAK